jgi:hypothetical protein
MQENQSLLNNSQYFKQHARNLTGFNPSIQSTNYPNHPKIKIILSTIDAKI